MVLHLFISFLGGVPLCILYGLYSGTSLGGTTWGILGGFPGRVLSGNLPLVVQFRVLCRLGLLTAQHSFLFLFLFPLFLPFLLLFSFFFFFSFPPFLFSFPPFLFSYPPPSPCCSHGLILKTPCVKALYSVQRCHAWGHMACHVSHMHAFAMHYDTWISMCHSHGLPCHPHDSPCVTRHTFPRNT